MVQAGNNRIPSGSMYTTYSVAGTSEKGIYFDETTAVVLKHGNVLSNPGLKWETTVSRNAGIETLASLISPVRCY